MTTVGAPPVVVSGGLPRTARPRARRLWSRPVVLVAGLPLAAAVAVRFYCRSALWLDEAQTVAIARQPLSRLATALRHDGSPPLYYALLHCWMAVFGTSGGSVRALSAVLGAAAIPAAWAFTRRLAGDAAGLASALVVACSPYAVFLATEARMYSLVVTLTLLGGWLLVRVLDRPGWPRMGALAAATGALLLTHYWALFLVLTTGAGCLAAALLRRSGRRAWLSAAAALTAGFLLFAPWWPVMRFQVRHTGTPWAAPPTARTLRGLLADWSVPAQTARFRALPEISTALVPVLAVLLAALVVIAVLGRSGRAPAAPRAVAGLALVALLVSALASVVGHGGYEPRYTAAVFALVTVVAGVGAARLPVAWRGGVLGVLCAAGLLSSVAAGATSSKTQAGMIAAAIRARAHPGDVVVFCPDQLAPAVSRLLPGSLVERAFPIGSSVTTVDWVDYAKRNSSATPVPFAASVDQVSGGRAVIWLVDVPHGYATFGDKCGQLRSLLGHDRLVEPVIKAAPHRFYEFANLTALLP